MIIPTTKPATGPGMVVGTAGAIASIPMHLGPSWYPIALAVTGLPLCWLGGVAQQRSMPPHS